MTRNCGRIRRQWDRLGWEGRHMIHRRFLHIARLLHIGQPRFSRFVVLGATFVFAGLLGAQNNAKQEAPAPPSAPAPKHDLSGVWMMRNPAAMRAYTGATFTKEEPELTE